MASSTRTGTFDMTRTTGVPVGQVPLDERRPDPGGEADDQVVLGQRLADLLEQRLHVLGLHREHERGGPTYGLRVGQRGGDPQLVVRAPAARSSRRAVTTSSPSARPLRPDQAGQKRLAHAPAAEKGDPSLRCSSSRPIDTARPGQEGYREYRDLAACPSAATKPGSYLRRAFETKNQMLAGRSASRRVKYGYHWVPYGT